jgi:hypothetical protein
MRVQAAHTLGLEAARERLGRFVDQLAARAWPGVVLRDVTRQWTGDHLDFAFVAAKGFFSATIRGGLDAADTHAVLDIEIPPMVAAFVGEDRIRETVGRELERILASD